MGTLSSSLLYVESLLLFQFLLTTLLDGEGEDSATDHFQLSIHLDCLAFWSLSRRWWLVKRVVIIKVDCFAKASFLVCLSWMDQIQDGRNGLKGSVYREMSFPSPPL